MRCFQDRFLPCSRTTTAANIDTASTSAAADIDTASTSAAADIDTASTSTGSQLSGDPGQLFGPILITMNAHFDEFCAFPATF